MCNKKLKTTNEQTRQASTLKARNRDDNMGVTSREAGRREVISKGDKIYGDRWKLDFCW